MFGKLAAVVRGDGLQRLPLVRQEQPLDGLGQRLRFLSVPEFFHEQEIRTPFRECEDGVAVLVHDDIHFPIAETFAVGFRRTLVYAHAVADIRGLGLMPTECLAPVLHLMAAMSSQFSAFVLADYGVNCFMRDVYTLPSQTS